MATTISQTFSEFKSRLELSESFQNKITTRHNSIREWIESYDPKIETKLIGSLQRNTRIQPRSDDTSDIDILVILSEFHGIAIDGRVSPSDAIDKAYEIMKEHGTYKKIDPAKDYPTVYIEYSDSTKVELAPAYKDFIYEPKEQGYIIPKSSYEWISADYDYDAEYILRKNKETDGYLIPTIKMLKAAKRNLFPKMKSYHLEVLTVNIIPSIVSYWKNKGHSISFPFLVYKFFCIAKDEILKSAKIPGNKSPNADTYLSYNEKTKLAKLFKTKSDLMEILITLDGKKLLKGGENYLGKHSLLMDNIMEDFKNNQKIENLINECRQIEEDSTYTAEAHYLLAVSLSRKSFWFKFVPVIITGVSALALLLGSSNWVSWITLTSSIIAIINIILEPESKAREHEFTAKSFTVLKHEARSLHETLKDFMDEKDFYYEVKRIREKYNWSVQTTPPTDEKSFEKAREIIKKGIHKPNFKKGDINHV